MYGLPPPPRASQRLFPSRCNPQVRHINAIDLSIIHEVGETCHRCSRACVAAIILLLPRLLSIAANNLDLLSLHRILVVELEVDIFDEERPHFIAKSVRIQMTLPAPFCQPWPLQSPPILAPTLKFKRAFTLSASTSVIDLSKVAMTFMAVWGSIRPE